MIGALALAVGAATGSTAAARGVAAGVTVVGYAVDGLAPLVGWLGPLQLVSPFHDYTAPHALVQGASGVHALVAAVEVIGLVVLAAVAFDSRDAG